MVGLDTTRWARHSVALACMAALRYRLPFCWYWAEWIEPRKGPGGVIRPDEPQ